jgi:hypothetical protein
MHALLALLALTLAGTSAAPYAVDGGGLGARLAPDGGLLQLTSRSVSSGRAWLAAPAAVSVRDEGAGPAAAPSSPTRIRQEWTRQGRALCWEISVDTDEPRRAHELRVDLPVLRERMEVFTPSERGVVSVREYPTYRPQAYGTYGWGGPGYYVLPLVSVLDPASGSGLTIALAPDQVIPHLQVEWEGGRVLRLILGHRGVGGGEPSRVRLVLYGHEDDYRSALRAYSDDFPRWFRPGLPRAGMEGAFWYHHIQDRPDAEEMRRQNVRWMWSSFWFPYLGEYLPEETEWEPFTYARMWALGKRLGDREIRAFAREVADEGIDVTAYMNFTEYGGKGGKLGDSADADRMLAGPLAAARTLGADGNPIGTWEGAVAMNPRPSGPLLPHLMAEVDRHLARLPELAGFTVDRLDWCSAYDYGQSDGVSMVGERSVELLAGPVGEALDALCERTHARGKRVFVNQFWRLEMLRDVDGYCHEFDFPRGIGYLSPYRPASAWHARMPYSGDLLRFEAGLKERLLVALQPQMIAHSFPISQQAPDPEAADMLELYAPLFSRLRGADQVLGPHCVSVDGANDANLLRGPEGYLVPVTSRIRFLARGHDQTEAVAVHLRVRDAESLAWAWAYAPESRPTRVPVEHAAGEALVRLPAHRTATVLLVGGGTPAQPAAGHLSTDEIRERLASVSRPGWTAAGESGIGIEERVELSLRGAVVGSGGPVRVYLGGRFVGEAADGQQSWSVPREVLQGEACLELRRGDEGAWFVPDAAGIYEQTTFAFWERRLSWQPGDGAEQPTRWVTRLRLHPPPPDGAPGRSTVREVRGAIVCPGGPAGLGTTATFLPLRTPLSSGGYALRVSGAPYTWAAASADPRLPRLAGETPEQPVLATCWFDPEAVALQVTPPDSRPYRLTLYLLDYDRHGRVASVRVGDRAGLLRLAGSVSAHDYGEGAPLTWQVTGPVWIDVRNLKGLNTTVSGVFVDRE